MANPGRRPFVPSDRHNLALHGMQPHGTARSQPMALTFPFPLVPPGHDLRTSPATPPRPSSQPTGMACYFPSSSLIDRKIENDSHLYQVLLRIALRASQRAWVSFSLGMIKEPFSPAFAVPCQTPSYAMKRIDIWFWCGSAEVPPQAGCSTCSSLDTGPGALVLSPRLLSSSSSAAFWLPLTSGVA